MNRSLIRDYVEALRYPGFWIYSTWLEVVTRHRRTRLGLLWALMPPVLYAFGLGGFLARVQGSDPSEFIAHICIGYVIFRFITVALSEATTACIAHASFILDGRVRLTDYVLRVIAKALFYLLLSTPVVAVALYMSPTFQWEGLFVVIPALILVILNIAWMGVIATIIGARMPDASELVGSALMVSFLFTPIVWHISQTPPGTIRGAIARANPLFHFMEIVRAPLLGEPIERLTYIYLAVLLPVGSALAVWVYRRFARYVPLWV